MGAVGQEQLELDLSGLGALGLATGDRVRFRRRAGGRWREGTVDGLHKDGSVALHESETGPGGGKARAIRAGDLEVARPGPRGGRRWVPVTVGG